MNVKTSDRWNGVFWLIMSIFICVESYRLGLGSYHSPGAGFLPFWTGVILATLSVLLFILTWGAQEQGSVFAEKTQWRSIVLALALMLAYALVIEKLGFVISTLLFVAALLRFVEHKSWSAAGATALITALATYVVFELWLQSQLPPGIFGL